MVGQSGVQTFEWPIEDILPAHPHLYLEHCAAMAAAVMSRGSGSPYELEVECRGFSPPAVGGDTRFRVRVSWTEETAARAQSVVHAGQGRSTSETP